MTLSPIADRLRTREAGQRSDRRFRSLTGIFAVSIAVLLALIALLLVLVSSDAWRTFGVIPFVTGTTWDPVQDIYGAWPYIAGTLESAAIALVLAAPIALFASVFLAEWCPKRLAAPLTFIVELLAAIPSVVIGLWGVYVLGPFLRDTVGVFLSNTLGDLGWFSGTPIASGLYVAGVILAIMILPTIISLSREVMTAVPQSQREAMLALGATRWETVRWAVLPAARSGVVGAVILGLGRAIGETMAVTMVIGNGADVPTSIFSQANTIASKIATTFNEAAIGLNTSALMALGLILLVISVLINVIARRLVGKTAVTGR